MAELEERSRRIIESALILAEEGGFEAVRLRDIAAHANVALGTVYKRFSGKEDILAHVLDHEMELLEQLLVLHPTRGDQALERLSSFFEMITGLFFSKPRLTRAVLRATTSGEQKITQKVARFHDRMTGLIAAAVAGDEPPPDIAMLDKEHVAELCFHLSQVWFAAVVGWMGGLFDQQVVISQTLRAGELLLAGFQSQASQAE